MVFLGCGVSSNSDQKSSKVCVESIIKKDSELGKVRNHACEKLSLSETIIEYTTALKQLDFSACEKEFEVAFSSHINAWENAVSITDKYPMLRGEMHDLFDKIELTSDSTEFKSLVASIWSTWGEVESAMGENEND